MCAFSHLLPISGLFNISFHCDVGKHFDLLNSAPDIPEKNASNSLTDNEVLFEWLQKYEVIFFCMNQKLNLLLYCFISCCVLTKI